MPRGKSKKLNRQKAPPAERLRTKTSERLLIDAASDVPPGRVLCTSLGRGQLGVAIASAQPVSDVRCLYLDQYRAERARETQAGQARNLQIICEADLPPVEFDAVVLPTEHGGEAELVRDLMQSGQLALRPGGRMIVSTDRPDDRWLHDEMKRLFAKVTRRPFKRKGVVYLATRQEPVGKVKNFEAEFAFRDGERLVKAVSRPGVFSHRRVDVGARALLEAMVVGEGERVLDLGCGSGILSLAAAQRAANVHVHAVDSNPRAVQCTQKGAELNGLTNITVQLDAEACRMSGPAAAYDLVVTNPPYYSNYRIAEIFLEGAHRALKPGGRVQVVTKNAEWYQEQMPRLFDKIAVEQRKTYLIVSGRKRG